MPHLSNIVYPLLRVRHSAPCILNLFQRIGITYRPYSSSETVRAAPIRVVRVVVVDIPCAVNIPIVVRVAPIAGAQPHVDSGTYSLQPVIKAASDFSVPVSIFFMPSFQCNPEISHFLSPVKHFSIAQMKVFPAKLDLCK